MGRTRTASRWVADADLSRSSGDDLELAWRHRDALLTAARTLVVAAGHDPDVGNCDAAGCGLARHADPVLCATVDRLARVPGASPSPVARPDDVAIALVEFLGALAATADSIRCCRQTAHAGAECWFSPVAGLDGCGEVLRLLHRYG